MVLPPVHADTLAGKVVRILDGDTVEVRDARKLTYRMRLAGVDSAEPKQPFDAKAKRAISAPVAGERCRRILCLKSGMIPRAPIRLERDESRLRARMPRTGDEGQGLSRDGPFDAVSRVGSAGTVFGSSPARGHPGRPAQRSTVTPRQKAMCSAMRAAEGFGSG